MKKDLKNSTGKSTDEVIVIPDECGDSMWDEVLKQEVKVCDIKDGSESIAGLLNGINSINNSGIKKGEY